jgi:regulatory protein RepA
LKIFPLAAKDRPLTNWRTDPNGASDDPEVHKMWTATFKDAIKYWGVPCGPMNGILALDVDIKGDNGFETLKNFQLPNTFVQRTPSGGAHYLFKYPKDGKHYGNRVKFLPGLDTRGEGGYIVWYSRDPITELADAPAWLNEKAYSVHDHPVSQTTSSVRVAPEVANKIIQESLDRIREAAPGESNNTLNVEAFKLGQLVASQSIAYEYAFEALFKAAKARGKPDFEAKATIASGLEGGAKKPILDPFPAVPPPPGIDAGDWMPSITTREELFDHAKLRKPQVFEHWSTTDIHLTTADGGTGKTTLKLYEAVCLALGERFLGFRCLEPGRTLFITGEDTDKKLKAMTGRILRDMGLTEDPANNAKVIQVMESIYIKKDADLTLIVKDRVSGFLIPNLAALDKISKAIERIKPRLIVFDPISSFWGSESSLNDMAKAVTKFMSELTERSNACVEMINHMGKQSSSQKDVSQFAGRGGSGLPSHSRVVRTLHQISNLDYTKYTGETLTDKESAMKCDVSKFSDGSPLYNKPFLIKREGFIFSRKDMLDSKAREAEQKLTDVERVFQFIQESVNRNQFPSRAVVISFFKTCGDPIPKSRTEAALSLLEFSGHMGDRLKVIQNPDVVQGGRVYQIEPMS